MSASSNWSAATKGLRERIAASVGHEELKELHRLQPWKHFLVLGWQYLLMAVTIWGILRLDVWYLWLPCAVVLGLTIFNFTVMLHEVVHRSIYRPKLWPAGYAVLGWMYAFPSGISRTQFEKWHLDHHAGLGTVENDPKRHHLSPKRNARWYKALYLTPALIPIYFAAAARENATYPPELRAKIKLERTITVVGQLGILAALWFFLGGWIAFKLYLVPILFVFPVAFTLNRLGQHYCIDPSDPAKWGTRMQRSRLWEVIFLWSAYHLEHHYFPKVPFYNLRRLNIALEPFWAEIDHRPVSYGELVWKWFGKNARPHTRWEG